MNKYIIFLISSLLLFSVGCEKEISGCMDTNATNYNPAANTDDGSCDFYGCTDIDAINYDSGATIFDNSCLYEAYAVIWWDVWFHYWVEGEFNSFPAFTVTIDGETAGTISTSGYYISEIDCEDPDAFVQRTLDLGFEKEKDVIVRYYYKGNLYLYYTITVFANECTSHQEDGW
tara:strand:- start:457 stop:978 length:522 start_codon:yes stop_codon:yes gene_type:complete